MLLLLCSLAMYLYIVITGCLQDETPVEKVQEIQQLKRNLIHDFAQTEQVHFQTTQQQYLAGRISGGNLPQQMGYDSMQGLRPQDWQQRQQFFPHVQSLTSHAAKKYQHNQAKYRQEQSYPSGHSRYTGAQLGAQENVQSVQQPPVCQLSTVPQVQQQQPPPVTTTSPLQCPLLSEAQIDQQIHKHQQRLRELQQQQQQLFLAQEYEQLQQIQLEAQQKAMKLDQLLTLRWKMQVEQQHKQKQSKQPPAPQQHHQKQYDNRQTVSEQPGQHSHQLTVHVVNLLHSHTPPGAPYQLMNTNTRQTNIQGKHQGTTDGTHHDVIYETPPGASQGTQWGTAQKEAAKTQLTQEQISRLRQHRVPSETQTRDFQAPMEHRLTIQDHQTTADTNMDSNVLTSHQPTNQKQHHPSVVFPHKEHTGKDEFNILVEKHEVAEQLRGQSTTALSQKEALQVLAKQLTEGDFSQEQSLQGDFMQSQVSCQQDKEWSELMCKLFVVVTYLLIIIVCKTFCLTQNT